MNSLEKQLSSLQADRVVWIHERALDELLLAETKLTMERALGMSILKQPITGGESIKTLAQVQAFWKDWNDANLTRHSLVICQGGGALSDVVGFAASTYKRGMKVAYIPTTVLGMVDAAWGGKTGINLEGGKNLIGTFHLPDFVHIEANWLETLSTREYRAGFAEVVKHHLISTHPHWTSIQSLVNRRMDSAEAGEAFEASAKVKQRIVDQDPTDQSTRHVLNLGHTVGHAIESWSMTTDEPWLHGEAVALGLRFALFESTNQRLTVDKSIHVLERNGEPTDPPHQLSSWLREHIPPPTLLPQAGSELWAWMTRDKKNVADRVADIAIREHGQLVWPAFWKKSQFEATWSAFLRFTCNDLRTT